MYLSNEKLYLYAFLDTDIKREDVTKYLDTQPGIKDWFYSLPSSIFIRTSISGRELSDLLERKFGQHRHIVFRVSDDRWGRLPKDHWERFP